MRFSALKAVSLRALSQLDLAKRHSVRISSPLNTTDVFWQQFSEKVRPLLSGCDALILSETNTKINLRLFFANSRIPRRGANHPLSDVFRQQEKIAVVVFFLYILSEPFEWRDSQGQSPAKQSLLRWPCPLPSDRAILVLCHNLESNS